MKLSGLHLLLTYQCTFECDHCFVFGSPRQSGTLTLDKIQRILTKAKFNGVTSIYFEGGEPFLYYAVLVKGTELAHEMGFEVGLVTNGYWATTPDDATAWLQPFAGRLVDLSVSVDDYHGNQDWAKNAQEAAKRLSIPVGSITVAPPEGNEPAGKGQIPTGGSAVMFRGRAAEKLAHRSGQKRPWSDFTSCPHEDFRDPGRVHVDPFGHLHICQGISIGNLFDRPLDQICADYDPEIDPILGPLLEGGPAELVRRHRLEVRAEYADACQLCFESRCALRERFPEILCPDQAYGVPA